MSFFSIRGFLSSLPAILGLTGFVVFQLLRSTGSGDPIVLRITQKLRNAVPSKLPRRKLTAEQLQNLLDKDNALKQLVSEQDFRLLRQVLRQQFIISMLVYVICAILLVSGIWLYLKQANRLDLESIVVQSANPNAGGLAVDIDDLAISWKSNGTPEEIDTYLQNVETGSESTHLKVQSSANKVVFCRRDYVHVLSNRAKGGSNRIEAVLQGRSQAFTSKGIALQVGIRIVVIAFPEKVTVAAMIDNHRIDYYSFEAKVLLPFKDPALKPVVLGDEMKYGKTDFPVANLAAVDWNAARIVYFNPDDQRIVRTGFIVDSNLGGSSSGFESTCGESPV